MHKLALQGVQSCLVKVLVASVCGLKGDRRLKQFVWEDFPRLSSKWHEAEKRGTAIMLHFREKGRDILRGAQTTSARFFVSSFCSKRWSGLYLYMKIVSYARRFLKQDNNNVLKVFFHLSSYPNHTVYINGTRQRLSIFAPSAKAELPINFYIISPKLSRCPQTTWKLHIWYI